MSGDRNSIGSSDLLAVFGRALLIQASWSYDRMQSLGFGFAMEPVLRKLYPDAAEYDARLRVHLEYFNTQPSFASFLLGAAARLEQDRATGQNPAADPVSLKTSLMAPLGAMGDSFFWGALRPFAAVAAVAVFLLGSWWAPFVFLVLYNVWHVGLRLAMLFWGFHSGGEAVVLMSRYRFTSVTKRFKMLSLGMLGGLLGLVPLWRTEFSPMPHAPRFIVSLAALAVTLLLVEAMRRGGSPVKFLLGLAAACIGLAYAGVV